MSAPDFRAAHPEGDVDYVRRMRMMGIHVPCSTFPLGRVNGGSRPSGAAIRRSLAALHIDRGPVTGVDWFTARRPVARVAFADDGPDLVMKWADQADLRSDNEFVMRRVLDGLPLPALTRRALPAVVAVDHDAGLVITEGVAGAVPWSDLAARGATPRPGELHALGATVAGLHGVDPGAVLAAHPDRRAHFPVPSMRRLTPAELAFGLGVDFGDYVVALQAVDEHLERLSADWSDTSLVHFDLRDDNVLFGAPGGRPRLAVVDWELCGVGDPMYDLGVLVGQVLFHRLLRFHRAPTTEAVDAVRTVVDGYATVRALPDRDRVRMTGFAGLFLLMTALGRLEKIGALGQVGHLALLVGRQLVEHADRGAVVLCGAGGGS